MSYIWICLVPLLGPRRRALPARDGDVLLTGIGRDLEHSKGVWCSCRGVKCLLLDGLSRELIPLGKRPYCVIKGECCFETRLAAGVVRMR